MIDSRFEWDNAKAARNYRDHGVTFDQAVKAVSDPFAIEMIDEREDYGEERINLLGMCDGTLLHVTYGSSQNLPKIVRFRNGLLVVKPRFHIQRSLARRASAPFIAP